MIEGFGQPNCGDGNITNPNPAVRILFGNQKPPSGFFHYAADLGDTQKLPNRVRWSIREFPGGRFRRGQVLTRLSG